MDTYMGSVINREYNRRIPKIDGLCKSVGLSDDEKGQIEDQFMWELIFLYNRALQDSYQMCEGISEEEVSSYAVDYFLDYVTLLMDHIESMQDVRRFTMANMAVRDLQIKCIKVLRMVWYRVYSREVFDDKNQFMTIMTDLLKGADKVPNEYKSYADNITMKALKHLAYAYGCKVEETEEIKKLNQKVQNQKERVDED